MFIEQGSKASFDFCFPGRLYEPELILIIIINILIIINSLISVIFKCTIIISYKLFLIGFVPDWISEISYLFIFYQLTKQLNNSKVFFLFPAIECRIIFIIYFPIDLWHFYTNDRSKILKKYLQVKEYV